MSMPAKAATILQFWNDLGPAGWYEQDDAVDAEIRDRFMDDWIAARAGGYQGWQSSPEGVLSYLILTDQFPRNMFRGDARSFATDERAHTVATRAWLSRIDLKIDEPLRQFFYMPMMHSESSFDQDRCVCLMLSRMPKGGVGSALHARAHRNIIRKFGRFPYRNDALGRTSTPAEVAFLTKGGYGEIVRALQS